MTTARVFKSGNSQAVRLPKEYQFDTDEVIIRRVGHSLVLTAAAKPWQSLVESLDMFTDDYLSERNQPALTERETL